MSGNVPNISRDSFVWDQLYNNVVLQQGVPVVDSDWNEQMDIALLENILRGAHILGDMLLPPLVTQEHADGNTGFTVQEATVTTNNFEVAGGWALCKGVLVPTYPAYPPLDIDYDSNLNKMGYGTVTSVNGGAVTISDTEKNWQTFHNLVGCRVYMTSGAESGNTFTVVALTNPTTLQLNSVGSIAATDTYLVLPPVLTTPSGGDRTDKVYLMVWFEDVSENEEGALLHPGLGVAPCHRKQRRWCVRVAEGGSVPSTPDIHDVASASGVRYMLLATLSRLDTNAAITTAMIEAVPVQSKLTASSKLIVAEPVSVDANFAGTNKVQLTGTFFVGKDASADPTAFFNIHDDSPVLGRREPYVENNELVTVSQVRDSSDSGAINPATDPDENGFYTNPYIVASQAVLGTQFIYAFKKKIISDVSQLTAYMMAMTGNEALYKWPRVQDNATITGVREFKAASGVITAPEQTRFNSVPYINSLQGGSTPPGMTYRELAMGAQSFRQGLLAQNIWGSPFSTINRRTANYVVDSCMVIKNNDNGMEDRYICTVTSPSGGTNQFRFVDAVSGDYLTSLNFNVLTSSDQILACCSDGDTVYLLYYSATNAAYEVDAIDWVAQTRKSGWSSYVTLTGSLDSTFTPDKARMLIAPGYSSGDTRVAILKGWESLTSSSVYGIAMVDVTDGTMTEGNGDYSGTYHANNYVTGLCTDGWFVYFGINEDSVGFSICSANPANPSSGIGSAYMPQALASRPWEMVCTGTEIVILEFASGVSTIQVFPLEWDTTPGGSSIQTIPDTGTFNHEIMRGAFDGENLWYTDQHTDYHGGTYGGYVLKKIPAASLMSGVDIGNLPVQIYALQSELELGVGTTGGKTGRVFFDGDSIWVVKEANNIKTPAYIARVPRAMYR